MISRAMAIALQGCFFFEPQTIQAPIEKRAM